MACLDTTVLLDLLGRGGRPRRRRATDVIRRLASAGEILTTTRFNVAELLVGVARAPDRAREERAVAAALCGLQILEFDASAAQVFAEITAYLQQRGRPAGDKDVLLAAIALVNGESLVTRDIRHFARIPGLRLENY
jgi:predicted nucleic acid-binding protein